MIINYLRLILSISFALLISIISIVLPFRIQTVPDPYSCDSDFCIPTPDLCTEFYHYGFPFSFNTHCSFGVRSLIPERKEIFIVDFLIQTIIIYATWTIINRKLQKKLIKKING